MIKGVRREFKNYNVYKTAKLALGFSENDSDLNSLLTPFIIIHIGKP